MPAPAVMAAQGTELTNKYAEGYPGKRYYGGCEFVDGAERLAIERAGRLFGTEFVNVQPHSGAQANMAVYFASLEIGDTILAMNLAHGGHLTHGMHLNFSGKWYRIVPYGVRQDDERLDMDEIARLAREHKPRMIVAGASAYSRVIDFSRFAEICAETQALFMVDMAHIAGLVAGRSTSQPGALGGFCYVDHAQNFAWATRRHCHDADQGVADQDQPGGVSGLAGRAAHARHPEQGGCFWGGLAAVVQGYAAQIIANARTAGP